jgi:hypothetical protein
MQEADAVDIARERAQRAGERDIPTSIKHATFGNPDVRRLKTPAVSTNIAAMTSVGQ